MHIVIFAGGVLRPGKAVDAAIAQADYVIAADGGAATALSYGCTPSIVVGDFDSLDPTLPAQLRAQGIHLLQAAIDKNETDTDLAAQPSIEQRPSARTLLAARGASRSDHPTPNILFLTEI